MINLLFQMLIHYCESFDIFLLKLEEVLVIEGGEQCSGLDHLRFSLLLSFPHLHDHVQILIRVALVDSFDIDTLVILRHPRHEVIQRGSLQRFRLDALPFDPDVIFAVLVLIRLAVSRSEAALDVPVRIHVYFGVPGVN